MITLKITGTRLLIVGALNTRCSVNKGFYYTCKLDLLCKIVLNMACYVTISLWRYVFWGFSK